MPNPLWLDRPDNEFIGRLSVAEIDVLADGLVQLDRGLGLWELQPHVPFFHRSDVTLASADSSGLFYNHSVI
jgi:hypothetical protein